MGFAAQYKAIQGRRQPGDKATNSVRRTLSWHYVPLLVLVCFYAKKRFHAEQGRSSQSAICAAIWIDIHFHAVVSVDLMENLHPSAVCFGYHRNVGVGGCVLVTLAVAALRRLRSE